MELETQNDDVDSLNVLKALAISNCNAVSRFGARLVVQSKFIEAVLPQLRAAQCGEIARRFQQGVEDAMAHTDDIEMPAEYHAELLELTNALLTVLEAGNARPR